MEFDRHSISSMGSRQHTFERPGSDIKMTGYLKKLKTMKKKFFVLRCTSSSGPARLEYYDSEKKFKAGYLPKRSIHLHTCFNINRRSDCRHSKHGIALYTNDECFTILTDSEKEQEAWLSIILEFQNEYLPDGDMHKEHYEHVWQVTLQPRGLGQSKGSKGQYRLCLNSSTVCLVRTNSSLPQFTIQLVTIRTVAHHENSFRLEVGNYAPTGAGEFWFTVEDSSIVKDMHETLLQYMNAIVKDPSLRRELQAGHQRSKRDVHSQPATCFPSNSMDAHSPSSPNFPVEYPGGAHRLRSDSRTSRTSKTSFHEDLSPGFITGYNGDHLDVMREHCSVVPPDMSPPPSPSCLDDQLNAYMAMDMEKSKQRSSLTSITSSSTQSSSYLPMEAHGQSHKGELNSPYPDEPMAGYMPMAGHHSNPPSHPIPIHTHSFSEPLHSSHLPTVREGGSNEGYLPMDVPSSPASSSGMPRPEPAVCMLSDNSTGLPPRTYSLGSKPTKKFSSYVEMGPKKGAGNDMSRATSAPHILKGRREREQRNESPTPNASPLSMSLKSDDSDSFMEYMPMRPRTASDSFNYRNRTSSIGKAPQNCRPRSSSHGQGTRPVINFSKLSVEKARISQEPMQRTSRESSLQGSFDSLRVSNESLRRMSQDMRQTSGSNASDYAEMRGTPSPQMKNGKPEQDGYVSMQVGAGGRKTSPHRVRTDSSSSGRCPEVKAISSDRLHQQPYLQQISDYTEMAPLNPSTANNGDSYMNMEYNLRHSFSSDSKHLSSASLSLSSHPEDPRYMNVNMDDKNKRADDNRSISMENVDTYVMYDPQSGNKPRTGSLGSKDKTITRPGSARKSSSASASSASSPSSSGIVYQQNQPMASSSTRTGGSSDSIKKTSRQSSTEKFGSLGNDFRKKSGSTGSRPSSGKTFFGINLGKDHHVSSSGSTTMRGSSSKLPRDDQADDEYVEFSPTATKGDNHHHQAQPIFSGLPHSSVSFPNSGRSGSSVSSGSISSTRSNPSHSPAEDEAYTLCSPAAVAPSTKSVHFHQQNQHSHHQHHPQQIKYGSSPSSSAQVKQIAAKDVQEYVEYDPGARPHSSYFPSNPLSNIKQVEAKETPQYVGFEPGPKSFPTVPSSLPKLASPKNQEDYVGYKPGTISQSHKPITPTSVISYIQNTESSGQIGLGKPKQHHMPSDNPPKLNKHDRQSVNMSPQQPTNNSLNFDHSGQPGGRPTSPAPSQYPQVPLLPVSPLSQPGHAVAKPALQDTSDYLKYNPSETSESKVSQQKMNTLQDKPSNLTSEKPQLAHLYVDVGEESKTSALKLASTQSGVNPPEQTHQKLQQGQRKLQQPPQNFQRQLSAPASQSSPGVRSATTVQELQLQPVSPQPMSPDSISSSRYRHLSSSSPLDSPSPTGSSSRHKHLSGSSNSSQKSRKSSSDSERSLRKGNKSELSGSSGSGRSRRRFPSDKKSPEGTLGDMSHRGTEGCFPTGTSALEAKMIPAEAKIRHSLGDVTSVVGKGSRESQDYHGLIRPDSSPCIQNLAPSGDQGSRSVGDTPNSTPRSGSIQFSVGPRSRHSLSDLGTYQQMNFTPSGLGPSNCDSSNSPGGKGMSNISGINESSIAENTPKPLNYVKLDLGCPESQGDNDGKSSRVKSRNSSDADERQPPLSYAEIDFVKSQCWSKTLPMGISGDSSSSKS